MPKKIHELTDDDNGRHDMTDEEVEAAWVHAHSPKKSKIMCELDFNGEGSDPDGAAAALRDGGFEVIRMPERFRPLMDEPGDEAMEAMKVTTCDPDEVKDEVEEIIEPFSGTCIDCRDISDDHEPFKYPRDQIDKTQR